MIGDIGGHVVGHRADGEVDLVGTQHGKPIAASDVVQLQANSWIGVGEPLHRLWQDVQNRRLAGGDVELASLELAALGGEGFRQAVHALHQRQRQLVERFALGRELDVGSAPLEQVDAELALQRLNLQ